jgi:4-amino-4-deoxy-L-arabinose transferase-like glycosyltransferase
MTRSDRIALILSALAVLAGYLVHDRVFERMAHIEDEMAYVWQAQVIARGQLTIPSPPEPKSFLYPFVVDYNGQRFGKYPLGWPAMLSLGERLGLRFLVNPLLAGLGVWLTYRLGKRIFGETVGLLAAGLTLTSPFFLMNSGSLLSHPFGLVLSIAFVLAWLDGFTEPQAEHTWLPTLVAGASLGTLALTRPFTAIGVGLPFGLHGLYLLVRGSPSIRRRLIVLGIIALAIGSLHLLWQYAATGDPFLNLYTLWWPYDQVGFWPGVGRDPEGHTLYQAWINTRHSLHIGYYDLFGWVQFSWIFLPLGLLAILKDRNWRALLTASVFISLLVVYLAYWIGSSLFGPRYYYEGLFSLTLTSAAGIAWLAGWPTLPRQAFSNYSGWRRLRSLAAAALLALLVSANLLFYTPNRLAGMHGLYGVRRAYLQPFLAPEAQQFTPALVIVHTSSKWIEYGTFLELENPFLDTPFIFIIARKPEIDAAVAASFPERSIYHYYPTRDRYKLYTAPLPPE